MEAGKHSATVRVEEEAQRQQEQKEENPVLGEDESQFIDGQHVAAHKVFPVGRRNPADRGSRRDGQSIYPFLHHLSVSMLQGEYTSTAYKTMLRCLARGRLRDLRSERYRPFAMSGRARWPIQGGLSPGNSVQYATVLEDCALRPLLNRGIKVLRRGFLCGSPIAVATTRDVGLSHADSPRV